MNDVFTRVFHKLLCVTIDGLWLFHLYFLDIIPFDESTKQHVCAFTTYRKRIDKIMHLYDFTLLLLYSNHKNNVVKK